MANASYQLLKRRQTMYIKAYGILCLVLTISVGFYSYIKWTQYSRYKQVVEKNRAFIEELRDEVSDEKAIYESKKDDFDGLRKEIEDKLNFIFPANDDYTILTRQIDQFEAELSKKNSPFEISSLSYQDGVQTDLYSILPLRMSIRSSRENFNKFLHLVENSGALNDEIRLMDISSIRLNFPTRNSQESGPEIITFTVQINAYFQ